MAEQACQEAVAYDLMRDIMFEDPNRPKPTSAEFRAYVLDLYAECLVAVTGKRMIGAHSTRLMPRAPTIVENNSNGGTAKPIEPIRNKKRLQQAQA